MPEPYPLTFHPLLFEKVWGGRRLAELGRTLPNPTGLYGESWELADMAATSSTGAGGGAARSVIAHGSMQGRTLREAMHAWGADLLGRVQPMPDGTFPLLIKFLDASENLSVQAHPSPEFAAANPGAHLKTESWYIMDVEPGALIYKGIKYGVTRELFEAHVHDGTLVNDLISIAAVPGTCHTLPSGTCHALGAGVLVAEVQTPSDTTFRVFDWGRAGRALHVREALGCIPFGPAPRGTRLLPDQHAARLATTEFYTIDESRPYEGTIEQVGDGSACAVVVVLAGRGLLVNQSGTSDPGGTWNTMPLAPGSTVLVPARCAAAAAVEAGPGLRYLRVGW
jgi:mannose-6-phosphate isomerase